MSSIADLLAIVNGNPEKTLDELILEIDNRKRFVPGTRTLVNPRTVSTPTEGKEVPVFEFIPELDGNVNLYVSGSGLNAHQIKIYRDGQKISEFYPTASEPINLSIKANSTYKFTVTRVDWASYQSATLHIKGDIEIIGYYTSKNL